jgi:hypothetical protein
MFAADSITFVVRERAGSGELEVVPLIGGVLLTTLIDAYELGTGMDPAGGAYGGLVPASYRFGGMERHFRGGSTETFGPATPVLGGECGQWDCWPLLCRIGFTGGEVRWDEFAQPRRPVRDYTRFGPFRFDRDEYEDALADLALTFA